MVAYVSSYPTSIDTSTELPICHDKSTPVDANSVNALRSAILATENTLGAKPDGTFGTVKDRLDNSDGKLNNVINESAASVLDIESLTASLIASAYTCGAGVNLGDAIIVKPDGTVMQAQANLVGSYPSIGIVIEKISPTECKVRYSGEANVFSGLTIGSIYCLSETPGEITATPPATANSVVQIIGTAKDNRTLILNISLEYMIVS